jgi:hypothetical protein
VKNADVGDPAGFDLAQRLDRNPRGGGNLRHAPRPARLAQHSEALPRARSFGLNGGLTMLRIIVPV